MTVSAALAAAASSKRTHIAGGDTRKEGRKELHPSVEIANGKRGGGEKKTVSPAASNTHAWRGLVEGREGLFPEVGNLLPPAYRTSG